MSAPLDYVKLRAKLRDTLRPPPPGERERERHLERDLRRPPADAAINHAGPTVDGASVTCAVRIPLSPRRPSRRRSVSCATP